jgi:predicted permease
MLMMFGYLAKRAKVLRSEDVRVVNSLLINITFPAFVFVSTHSKPFIPSMAVAPFVGFICEMAVVGLAYLIARLMKLDRGTTSALMLVSAFGNTGFLGYPVIHAAFPDNKHAMLSAVMFDGFGMALPLYTIGVAIATTFAGTKFDWKNLLGFLKTPIFPAMIISLLLRNVHIPSVIMQTLDYAGAATIPLAMMSIGMSLSTKSVGKYPWPMLVGTVLKLAVLPLAMFLLLPVFGIHGVVRQTVLVQSALPAAIFAGVIPERFGGNYEFAAGAIFATTLLSVLTIPLMVYFVK